MPAQAQDLIYQTADPATLSNAELTLGVPVSQSEGLLSEFGGLRGLRKLAPEELSGRGLSPDDIARLLAAVELSQRIMVVDSAPVRCVRADDAALVLMGLMGDRDQEQLRLVLLTNKHDVIGLPVISTGGLPTAFVGMADVFREPIRRAASSIILAHNHPSGDPTPSAEDVRLTADLVKAGKLLDIDVLDHLVIGRGRWFSLRSGDLWPSES
ncbi:MAG: JAB domain-containing protein [Chloroflexota bacterium]